MENSIQKGLSRLQILIMAITAGVSVASLYYVQPILDEVSKSLHKSENEVGLLPALAQAGYGLGLFFITPYGDKMNRKKLILLMLFVLVLALFGMALIHNLYGIYLMSLIIGAMGAAAQVVMPMAATLATENKGKIVGMVFTGLLSGILLARVVSGYSARLWGWQSIYMISAFVIMLMMVLVHFTLPNVGTQFNGTYGELLKSTIAQYKRFPKLRRLSIIGALVFGVFCSFWTTITFHLTGEPFFLKSDKIGLLGIVALGGALLAPIVGRMADKGSPARGILYSILVVVVSVILMMVFPSNIWMIVFSVFIMDVGVQAMQITNIATIYTLDESANSRINTVYMTCYFIGGALGTVLGVNCWHYGGWNFVLIQFMVLLVAAVCIAIVNINPEKYKLR